MSIGSLLASLKLSINYTAQNQPVGSDYSPIQESSNFGPTFSAGTAQANNVAGGADEMISAITSITASGNATINLQSLTDVLNQASISLARVKGIMIRLLSATDDSTYGTACSSIIVGAAASNPAPLFLGGTNPTITLNNGEGFAWATPSAGGIAVSSAANNLYIVNNDSVNAAAVQVSIIGGTT